MTDSTLTLTFSERLDGASAAAVTVTPSGSRPPEIRVDGRELVISLPTLRDSTTYVVTLGTSLKDTRGVSLRAPITFAFATGDAIDRAAISGRVRDPITGAGVQASVWAYALADSASAPPADAPPDYRTETGSDGAFTLSYLRRAPYAVVAVQDRNRNDRIDPGERVAVSPRAVLRADTTDQEPEPFWIAATDTIPPRAQRVRTLSDQRLSVRFDEKVRLDGTNASGWTVADSARGQSVGIRLYQLQDTPQDVFVVAETSLPPVPHQITYVPGSPPALVDSSGVAAQAFQLSFTPPTRADTVSARFLGFVPTSQDSVVTLRSGQRPGARFSSRPTSGSLSERVRLVTDDSLEQVELVSSGGVTLHPSADRLPSRFDLVVEMPDSTYRQRYAVATTRETGGIVGTVEGAGPIQVELRTQSGDLILTETDDEGAFVVDGLLPGAYTLRIWQDTNADGVWTSGAFFPYAAPEPLRLVLDPVQVRARWETEVEPIVFE